MFIKFNPTRIFTVMLLVTLFVSSCKKEDDRSELKYYVSGEMITSYNESYIAGILDAASSFFKFEYDLKELISSGVSLYKIVYKTNINGNDIYASGLVCTPTDPGDYPVLSFQNGTNTLHSNAPTELPSDYGFQIIELVASMGYIVVIADYPGFGESSDIPHPYLVAEPTVRSIVDMLYAVNEMDEVELPDISVKNEYYLIGYSQGGWATLQLHKALETRYNSDFNLRGSCAGAGPYNIYLLMQKILSLESFPMPYYIGYVINGYKSYDQFTNPVSDLLNEPYASRIPDLYLGQLNAGQINSRLTTSVRELVRGEFLAGFADNPLYSSVKQSMIANSIAPWNTSVPLLLIHGDADTHVDPSATEDMYAAMIQAGTPQSIIQKVIIPGADHGEGVAPALLQGFLFINNIRNSNP
jgi:pimeloyl-ACP methyl ester carboxylesterase